MKKIKAYIFIFNFLFVFSSFSPCSWCELWDDKPAVEQDTNDTVSTENGGEIDTTSSQVAESKEAEADVQQAVEKPEVVEVPEKTTDDFNFAQLCSGLKDGESQDDNLQQLLAAFALQLSDKESSGLPGNHIIKKDEKQEEKMHVAAQRFYDEYLKKYYPKAFVIGDYFFSMCPIAINAALGEFVEMASNKTWYIFKNKPEEFKLGEYWEIILQECRDLGRLIQRAHVNLEKGTVSERDFYSHNTDAEHTIPLSLYWEQQGMQSTLCDFYGYYADYVVRMFNEGINTENMSQCSRYSFEFKRVVDNIPMTLFDGKYHDRQRINQELMAELRKKLGAADKSSSWGSGFDDDDYDF